MGTEREEGVNKDRKGWKWEEKGARTGKEGMETERHEGRNRERRNRERRG